jgi:uncharacterized OB-fold protein
MRSGTVYTETVIYSAPEAFARDVPYQTAIIDLDDEPAARRVTCRILGDRVMIDDRVVEVEPEEAAQATAWDTSTGVLFFRKA